MGDVPAYDTVTVTLVDGLYLLVDSLIERCSSWHGPVAAVAASRL